MTPRHCTGQTARPAKRQVDLTEAVYVSCCRETIRRRIADGTVYGYRLGKRLLRVDLIDIDAAFREIPTAATRRP